MIEHLKDKEYTLSNLLIIKIQRLMDEYEKPHKEYSESEIVRIALSILKIMLEIPFGDGSEDPREWDYFFKAIKSRDDLIFFLYHLHQMGLVKNQLLNEVIGQNRTEDLEKLIKEAKGEE